MSRAGTQWPWVTLLDQACSSLYGLDSREQSALNLVYLFGSPDQVQGSLASGPLRASHKIVGGNERLPLALARSLPHGCIQLDHQLVALERTSEALLTLTFAVDGGTRHVQCDPTILALPLSALRRVVCRRAAQAAGHRGAGLRHDLQALPAVRSAVLVRAWSLAAPGQRLRHHRPGDPDALGRVAWSKRRR
jgi:Flavin containing amine oxidoreductase